MIYGVVVVIVTIADVVAVLVIVVVVVVWMLMSLLLLILLLLLLSLNLHVNTCRHDDVILTVFACKQIQNHRNANQIAQFELKCDHTKSLLGTLQRSTMIYFIFRDIAHWKSNGFTYLIRYTPSNISTRNDTSFHALIRPNPTTS